MVKVTLALRIGAVLALFVAESSCQKFIQPTFRPLVPNKPRLILPTFRPPPNNPIIRLAREVGEFTDPTNEDVTVSPLVYAHLNRTSRSSDSPGAKRGGGSHSTSSGSRNTGATHPGYNRRNARSVDSPSARRGGGSPRTSSGSRNTGPTHPGYNRRNAREIRLPGHRDPLRPKPIFPRPTFPVPPPRIPILARTARDIQVAGVKKPTHRDVIIPNWNPNVKTNPLNRGGGRHGRSHDSPSAKRGGGSPRTSSGSRNTGPTHPGYNRRNAREIRLPGHLNPLRPKPLYPRPMVPAPVPQIPILARSARDIQIPGVKKLTHRDVIIPNWNPNVRTSPWEKIGGRHRSLVDIEAELGPGSHERETRDIHVSGLPEMKKPTYRDVVIPNWNPHVRTYPWDSLGGGRHH